jgi:hypothetical protein
MALMNLRGNWRQIKEFVIEPKGTPLEIQGIITNTHTITDLSTASTTKKMNIAESGQGGQRMEIKAMMVLRNVNI